MTPEVEQLTPIVSATAPPGDFGPGRSSEAATISKSYGDLDQAFREAHVVIELELRVGRHSGVPLETRGAVARYDALLDRLELYGAAKVPHYNRGAIAAMLGLAPGALQLFEGHVGPVRAVVLSPDRRFVYSGGEDGTLRRWAVGFAALAQARPAAAGGSSATRTAPPELPLGRSSTPRGKGG